MKNLTNQGKYRKVLASDFCAMEISSEPANFLQSFQEVPEILDVFSTFKLTGHVLDAVGLPVRGALVEMWHPAQWNLYGMEYGPSFAPTDPDAQAWACCVTDDNGRYFFKTEKRSNLPGITSTCIDLKVTNENTEVAFTRVYFDEDVFDPTDPYLMDMEPEERYHLIGEISNGVCDHDILCC